MSEELYQFDESFRDSIATVDAEGKRNWVYPKKPKGRYHTARLIVAIFLLVFLFAAPFIKINGEQFLLFDVISRKFVILGMVFLPQDFHLFAIVMITFVIFIVLFTVAFGRLFCGWVCPQTIFMEMVFRKIEYWIEGDAMKQIKLDKMPWNQEKILKKGTKWLIFAIISLLISNIFTAYLVGSDKLLLMIEEGPLLHLGAFIPVVIFSVAFFFVFAWFREQACTTVCPYGRLQGVLLDRDSIVVGYDYKRGEPRGRMKKGEERTSGDCIACGLCVRVCPTGIDIKNGTQLECVNCTACMDVCDDVMDKVGFERGLIRYASENMIAAGSRFRFTGKMIAYSAVLVVMMTVSGFMLSHRTDIKMTVNRTRGVLFQKIGKDSILNVYDLSIINKTEASYPVSIRLTSPENGDVQIVGTDLNLHSKDENKGVTTGKLLIKLPRTELEGQKTDLEIGVYKDDTLEISKAKTVFLGPF